MVDTSNVKFPITLSEFTRLQRAEMRNDPTPDELEMFSGIVDMANEAYYAAARGDDRTVEDILKAISKAEAEIIREDRGNPANKFIIHASALTRGWVLLGVQHGMILLKAAIDGTACN